MNRAGVLMIAVGAVMLVAGLIIGTTAAFGERYCVAAGSPLDGTCR